MLMEILLVKSEEGFMRESAEASAHLVRRVEAAVAGDNGFQPAKRTWAPSRAVT
jgi:hypothetical protein